MPGVDTGNVVLQGADAFVFHDGKIFSYNDSIAVSVPLDLVGMVEEPVEGAVHANEFFNVISKFSGEEINFEITDNKTWLLKCGKAKVEMTLLDFDFTSRLEGVAPDDNAWNEITDEFVSAIGVCRMPANKTPISGIFFSEKIVLSSDGMQINKFELKNNILPTFWIADGSVNELLKIRGLKWIQLQGTWAHFKSVDGSIFSVKTLDYSNGKYPFERINTLMDTSKPKEGDFHATFPQNLFVAIDRANAFAIDISEHPVVRLTISGSNIEVTAERSSGKYSEKVDWDTEIKDEFEPITVYVDAEMMSFMGKKSLEFYLQKFKSKTGKIIPRLLFVSNSSSHLMTTFSIDK
jgi:hypothetical protein